MRHDLAQFIPATAELALTSMVIAVVVGVGLGVLAAVRRNRPTDHLLRLVSLGGISVPTFWLALICLYVFFFKLNWVPGGGRLNPGVLEPPHVTGFYTFDALSRVSGRRSGTRCATSCCPRSCSRCSTSAC